MMRSNKLVRRWQFILFAALFLQSWVAVRGLDAKPTQQWAHGAMAVTANPHATRAAAAMLVKGGHAVDAAIAAHVVLGLVEPQSSGIGGGAFILSFDHALGTLNFFDGREMAPAGAKADMFMRDGEVINFFEAWQSGLAVGVPGAVALYKYAHDKHGRLPWSELFQPAIELARSGFEVSPRLANFLVQLAGRGRLSTNPPTKAYFYPQGKPLQIGELLRNPEYAATLARIAQEGTRAFYQGSIAHAIVEAVQSAPNPGSLTLKDMNNYRVIERPVVCGTFRSNRICTTTPPSSGVAQIMIAGIYHHLVNTHSDVLSRKVAFVDAQRLAYADRDHYFGDPDTVNVPLEELVHPAYLRARAKQRFAPTAPVKHGDPGVVLRGVASNLLGNDTTQEIAGTTHLSIVDHAGNAVAMTATIEAPFGSSRWAHGFLLNNEMTDFARTYNPEEPPPANAIRPGARPRSSMSPTMVFNSSNELVLVTGSPGGNSIPAYVSKSIVGMFDWGLSPQAALDHANIIARGDKVRVEIGMPEGPRIANHLNGLGYDVQEREGENSGLHVIYVSPEGLVGAADVRREGTVWQSAQ